MTGRLIDLSFGRDRKQRILIEVDTDFRSEFDRLKDTQLDVTIKKHREKRSLSANAYFHVLVNKIAAALNVGDDEVKRQLVLDYGTVARDTSGKVLGCMIPNTMDASDLYPYLKCYDSRYASGVVMNCYILYKRTHTMDTKEMSRLIDGAIYEAKGLGIQTDTPETLARLKEEWYRKEQKHDGST